MSAPKRRGAVGITKSVTATLCPGHPRLTRQRLRRRGITPPMNFRRLVRRSSFIGGLAAGVVVTQRIHQRDSGIWTQRIGTTAFRAGDLPVGGAVATVLSLVAPKPLRGPLRALALGATLGVLAIAVSDPLDA